MPANDDVEERSPGATPESAAARLQHLRSIRGKKSKARQEEILRLEEEVRKERIAEALKRKEWERAEKWQKMAKNVKKGARGQGMEFEFDVNNPKLIERTWKGIPDRWRASAWHSFLASSAAKGKNAATEEQIIQEFQRLQEVGSPDDVDWICNEKYGWC